MCQGQADQDNLWNLLTINFKFKDFHISVYWSGLYFQVNIPSWLAKILEFTVFRLLENAFVKLPRPWHDLIITSTCRTAPRLNLPPIFVLYLPRKAFRKRSLHILWGETPCKCSTGKSCRGICSLIICKEVRTKFC